MPVIREQKQFKIGPIGIARASEGGRVVGQALQQEGDRLANMFYQYGAEEAEKAGLEAGQAIETASLLTINPETGAPEVYEPPSGYGRIASDAYQSTVRNRYTASLEDEIRARSTVLAEQFADNPESYRTAMNDYIASMSSQTTGMWSSMITDMGTSYTTRTTANLTARKIARERAAASGDSRQRRAAAYDLLTDTYARLGPDAAATSPESIASGVIEASGTLGPAVGIGEVLAAGYEASGETDRLAGIVDASEVVGERGSRMAIAEGLAAYALRRSGNSAESINAVNMAFITGDASVLADFPEMAYLGSAVGELTYSEREGIRTDVERSIRSAQVIAEFEARQQLRDAMESIDSDFDARTYATRVGRIMDAPNGGAVIASEIIDQNNFINDTLNQLDESLPDGVPDTVRRSALAVVDQQLGIFVNSATDEIIQATSNADVLNPVILALQSGNTDGLEEIIRNEYGTDSRAANAFEGIINLATETGNAEILDAVATSLTQSRDEIGFLQAQGQLEALADKRDEIESLITSVNSLPEGDDVGGLLQELEVLVEGIPERDAASFLAQASSNAALRELRIAYRDLNIAQRNALQNQILNPESEDAREAVVSLLGEDAANNVFEAMERANSLVPERDPFLAIAGQALEATQAGAQGRAEAEYQAEMLQQAMDGLITPGSDGYEDVREMVDDRLNLPSNLIGNPDFDLDPRSPTFGEDYRRQQMIVALSQGMMPTALQNSLDAIARGQIVDPNFSWLSYAQFTSDILTISTGSGPQVSTGAMGLDDDVLAFHMVMTNYARTLDASLPLAVREDMMSTRAIELRQAEDPAFIESMQNWYGRQLGGSSGSDNSPSQWLMQNFSDEYRDETMRPTLQAVAQSAWFNLSIENGGMPPGSRQLTNAIRESMDMMFAEDERVVSISGSGRTMYGLSRIYPGQEDNMFAAHMLAADAVVSAATVRSDGQAPIIDPRTDEIWRPTSFANNPNAKLIVLNYATSPADVVYGVAIIDEFGAPQIQMYPRATTDGDVVLAPLAFGYNDFDVMPFAQAAQIRLQDDAISAARSLDEQGAGVLAVLQGGGAAVSGGLELGMVAGDAEQIARQYIPDTIVVDPERLSERTIVSINNLTALVDRAYTGGGEEARMVEQLELAVSEGRISDALDFAQTLLQPVHFGDHNGRSSRGMEPDVREARRSAYIRASELSGELRALIRQTRRGE